MTADTKAEIARLKVQMAKLKPAPAPGILTNQTTRGVTRRPKAAPKQDATIPRYL